MANAHFTKTPGQRVPRSRHDLSNQVSFTCNVGDLIPAESWSVYPSDDFSITPNFMTRLQTLLAPLYDDIHMDCDLFFVPYRLVMDEWAEFMGENTKAKYYPTKDVFIPQITGNPQAKSVADYIGVPINNHSVEFEALIPRAYALIWNEWYRDQQLQDPILIDKSSNSHAYDNNNPVYGGKLLKACKYHDYFTSSVPQPQAGNPVQIPMQADADFPVYTLDKDVDVSHQTGLKFGVNGTIPVGNHVLGLGSNSPSVGQVNMSEELTSSSNFLNVFPMNLWANVHGLPVTDINSLRLAFATQQFLEINNFGTRYTEIIRNHFGVVSPDGRLQRPELIGHFHDTLNVSQVVQQSETGSTPLGDVAGLSATFTHGNTIRKAFTEHGVVLAMVTFRYKHSYQQGLARELSRKSKWDFYFPVFANLGEQPILNKEIYLNGTSRDNEVFGYQERWSELRHKVDRVAGELRSTYKTPLDYWTLQDFYKTPPCLDDKWIVEDTAPVNRAIAISDKTADQLIVNAYFNTYATRPIPVYSLPGLTRM